MIPQIEAIVEMLLAGECTASQAVNWLHQHAEDAGRDLRDEFAMAALAGWLREWGGEPTYDAAVVAEKAYAFADAMLRVRAALTREGE